MTLIIFITAATISLLGFAISEIDQATSND
jgi:hypothetical protein